MKKEEIKIYLGKRVRLILRNNFRYLGIIEELYDDSMRFADRYDGSMLINYTEILTISENLNGGSIKC